jgi:pyruvate carboxylase
VPREPVFPRLPRIVLPVPAPGTKQQLDELGPDKFAAWMLAQERVLLTDTSMRDAHQSLLATRFRTYDMAAIAPVLCESAPAAVFGRVLGRRDLRRRDALLA